MFSDRYKRVADFIDSAQRRGDDVVFYVDKMATDLDNSEIPSTDNERLRLEEQISATSTLLSERHIAYTPAMLDFVFALQKYIEDTYGDVNEFLSLNGIKVKVIFAELSEEVGFPIWPENIEEDNPSIIGVIS